MNKSSLDRYTILSFLFWLGAFASLPTLIAAEHPAAGWDLHVYANAVRSLAAGHDPYADGVAAQRFYHAELTAGQHDPTAMPPYTYVYSPITLPLLRVVTAVSHSTAVHVYWVFYILCIMLGVWAMSHAAETQERVFILLIAPAAAFFPGLLQNDVFFSGNLAFILYGLVLASAVLGWKYRQWLPFYAMVLVASCVKAPLLSLLVIPALSARRQWRYAGIATLGGLALFAVQPLLWPSLFHNYLEAVELQFSFNHDFGVSPAGLLGNVLYALHIPYSPLTTIFYLLYAAAVLATLIVLARRYFAGEFSLQQWMPVLMLGVVLLNPRIKEYDIAPLSIPMALVAWRFFSRDSTLWRAVREMSFFFLMVNGFAHVDYIFWKPIAGSLIAVLFAAGAWQLLHPETQSAYQHTPLRPEQLSKELIAA